MGILCRFACSFAASVITNPASLRNEVSHALQGTRFFEPGYDDLNQLEALVYEQAIDVMGQEVVRK